MMQNWEGVIYHIVELHGGEADLQLIYKKVPDYIDLTDGHWKVTEWGGRPAYQHEVRSYISNMCQSGLLHRTLRGRYKITEYKVSKNQR